MRNYYIYRKEFEGNWTRLAIITSANHQYVDETLVEDIGYFYAVAAFTHAGEGPLSEKVLTHTTDEEAPSDGTGVDGGLLSWTSPIIWIVVTIVVVGIVSGYIVRRKTRSEM